MIKNNFVLSCGSLGKKSIWKGIFLGKNQKNSNLSYEVYKPEGVYENKST